MRKQLTALLAAMTLCLSTAPMTSLAYDEPTVKIPDWIPRDYLAALDFCNTYGTTHTQDGFVCLVRTADADADMNENFLEESSLEPLMRFTPDYLVPRPADETDGKSTAMNVVKRYQFEVTVYQPQQPGELSIRWSNGLASDKGTTYTFEVTEDGKITETDIYGWLPDCAPEFMKFDESNPTFSVHDNYIVYAGTPCYDGGYQEYISQEGDGSVELAYSSSIGRLYAGEMPSGGSASILKLYRPVKAGGVQMTAEEKRSWEPDPVSSETAHFVIDENLNLQKAEAPGSKLPDWVPRDYLSALDFCNTYGTTHIQDGYVCLVRRAYADEDLNKGFIEESSQEPIERFSPKFIINPVSEKDGKESGMHVEQRYQFEVTLYHLKKGEELSIRWSTEKAPDKGTTFTFEVTEDGKLLETDIYGWLPDCEAEFYDFDEENPAFSVHDGYIVYAGSPCYDGGYQEYITQTGSGAVKQVPTRGIGRLYAGELPCGGSSSIIRVYRPVKAGKLQMTATEKRSWETEIVCSDTSYYVIDEELNVTETAPFEERYGDCNGDGELSVQDLVSMCKYLHGKGTLKNLALADMDGDGQVDIFDLAALRRQLLLQSPWKDGNVEFSCETVVNPNPYRPQSHKQYDVKWYSNLDATQCYLNDFDKADAVKLKEITEETYKDHAVLAVASEIGAGDRRVTVEGVERKGSRLIVHTYTYHTMNPTPDMAVIYNVIAVDKNTVEGIRDMIVDNKDMYEAVTTTKE
jgi:hypothetical protein